MKNKITKKTKFDNYKPVQHKTQNAGWLRAAVLGANDGIVSTASLIVGVASANATHNIVILTGVAGMVAGAMSMAAGEYVSVSSQADIESAELEREKNEHIQNIQYEHEELAQLYIKRGLNEKLARKVANELMKKDGVGAHAREELGISETMSARPVQAALSSAAAFAIGAILPILTAMIIAVSSMPIIVSATSLLFLIGLGAFASYTAGSNIIRGTARVVFWGAIAMILTAGAGKLFGTSI